MQAITSQHIKIETQELHYLELRRGNPLILILHGWGSSANAWRHNMELLGTAGYDVVIPDLPGFGKSPPPQSGWGVDEYAGLMAGFLREHDLHPQIVVGHSFGGRVSIRLLLRNPTAARGLVLCASSGLKHPKTRKQRLFYRLAKLGGAIFSIWPLSLVHSLARRALYRGVREYDYYRTQGSLRETFKRVMEDDIALGIEALTQPTLIMWGDQDTMTPPGDAYRFNDLIPHSEVEIFEGAGHRFPYEQADRFCKRLAAFVKSLEAEKIHLPVPGLR